MNKRHFLALIATLFITLGAFAQGNTYNMVLTLADGTVITIGPNDLTKLDFVEGTLTAEGTNITVLMNDMKAMKASIDALTAVVAASQSQIAALKNDVNDSEAQIKALNAKVNDYQTSITALTADVAKSQIDIKALQSNMFDIQTSVYNKIDEGKAELKAYTDDKIAASKVELQVSIQSVLDLLRAEIAENKIFITNEYKEAIDRSAADLQELMNAYKDMLQAQIDQNTEDINDNKASIEANADGIDTNRKAIITLIRQLRELGVIPNN